jgi:aldose 1-epimerase
VHSYTKEEIELSNGCAEVRVSPWGASLTALNLGGLKVVSQVTDSAMADAFAGVTLAPWPNRLANGHWQLSGVSFVGALNDEKGNANHGLVFDRKFATQRESLNSVSFSIELGQDEVYPFQIGFKVDYVLVDRALTVKISATNNDHLELPVAFGSHPYLVVSGDSKIAIPARMQLVSNSNQIPTSREAASKQLIEGTRVPRFDELELDDCFGDLILDDKGRATTTITHSDGQTVELWQDKTFKYLMVYTNRALDSTTGSISAIALEPQTAPPNALNSGEDLIWLAPGQTAAASWGIKVTSKHSEAK